VNNSFNSPRFLNHVPKQRKTRKQMEKATVKECSTPKPVRSLQGFDKLILESIDEGLSLLGEKSKANLYRLLDTSFGMKKSDILLRIDDFYDALEQIFGEGAVHLQSLFSKMLNEKMGRSCAVVQLSDFAVFDPTTKTSSALQQVTQTHIEVSV
jgi:hypothetical protein